MNTNLILGEAVASLRAMPSASVDLAVYDPPYATISGGTPDDDRRPSGILESNDGKIFSFNDIEPDDYLPELHRVLKDQAHVYMMCNVLGLRNGVIQDCEKYGFQLHNLLVWRKNNVTPNRWYMKNVEYTLMLRKGKAFPINVPGSKTAIDVNQHPRDLITTWDPAAEFPYAMDFDNVKTPKPHPTAKPVELMKTYIENSSQPGDTVLDMFMGAGSTGIACQELDRDFIGVEMDPEYYAVACKRMGIETSQMYQAMEELI